MFKRSDTAIQGTYILKSLSRDDSRGWFGRVFCASVFEELGLNPHIAQINHSLSRQKGTLRGLHYQLHPNEETKLVCCIRGSVWDVVLDLRPTSPTFKQWFGQKISSKNRLMMYVPQGCAHGFLSLEDNSEIIYFVSEFYTPERGRGVRWNDPAFAIKWPILPLIVSEKDQSHQDFVIQ